MMPSAIADGPTRLISRDAGNAQLAVLLVGVDAEPVVAVGECEVELGLEALHGLDNAPAKGLERNHFSDLTLARRDR